MQLNRCGKRLEKPQQQQQTKTGPSNYKSYLAAGLAIKAMTGAHAPFNDNSAWVDDPTNHKVYMIAGIRFLDDDLKPTSDFFCYDTVTMDWEDLTVYDSEILLLWA